MTASFTPVAVVVVTHNRLALLAQALDAFEAQTRPPDLIIVVDNASSDGTAGFLGARPWQLPHRIERMPSNLGGAAGFSHGIGIAAAEGYASWILDDDAVAHPTALEALLDDASAVLGTGQVPAFMCSTVEWTDGTVNRGNVPRPLGQWSSAAVRTGRAVVEVSSASFVSVLVPAAHVRAVGLPFGGYQRWYDDVEYTTRLSRRFGPGVCSLTSRIRHHTRDNDGVLPWLATEETLPSHVVGLRNRASATITNRDARGALELVRDLGRVVRADLPLRARAQLIGGAGRGLWYREPVRGVGPKPVDQA